MKKLALVDYDTYDDQLENFNDILNEQHYDSNDLNLYAAEFLLYAFHFHDQYSIRKPNALRQFNSLMILAAEG